MKLEEFSFITSQENQRKWAWLSIEKRCVLFHRTFTNRRIKKGVMYKIMRKAGLMMKRIEVNNVPARKEERVEEFT